MSEPQNEWLNEGTAEGCVYFFWTFVAYGLLTIGFTLGFGFFAVALLLQLFSGKIKFWDDLKISGLIWLGFSLLSLFPFWMRSGVKPPAKTNTSVEDTTKPEKL